MMQLIMVVVAISLAALLVSGGVQYLSGDAGRRTEVSQGLKTQHEALESAMSSYAGANGGLQAPTIDRLRQYMPQGQLPRFPRGVNGFTWALVPVDGGRKRVLCLSYSVRGAFTDPVDGDVAAAVANFALEAARREAENSVLLGTECGSGVPGPYELDAIDRSAVAVTFLGS